MSPPWLWPPVTPVTLHHPHHIFHPCLCFFSWFFSNANNNQFPPFFLLTGKTTVKKKSNKIRTVFLVVKILYFPHAKPPYFPPSIGPRARWHMARFCSSRFLSAWWGRGLMRLTARPYGGRPPCYFACPVSLKEAMAQFPTCASLLFSPCVPLEPFIFSLLDGPHLSGYFLSRGLMQFPLPMSSMSMPGAMNGRIFPSPANQPMFNRSVDVVHLFKSYDTSHRGEENLPSIKISQKSFDVDSLSPNFRYTVLERTSLSGML